MADSALSDLEEQNPFIRYRHQLDSYHDATRAGWSDERFVDLVATLDNRVAAVDGHGFRITPLRSQAGLAESIGLRTPDLWVKDDTGNVGGSHKARHLFGLALAMQISGAGDAELAIASCGNAAVAAATIARALDRPLRVFIPTWADRPVVDLLDELGAITEVCERREDEAGDPTYLRFEEAVARGSLPFSVQATATPSTIDGGRTIGWELAEQLHRNGVEGRLRLFVQVGGGALASALWLGLTAGAREWGTVLNPVLHAVQVETVAPLPRAWDLLTGTVADLPLRWPARAVRLAERPEEIEDLERLAKAEPDLFMQAWDVPGSSAASGILDDITYDWPTVVFPMIRSGGWPVVVTEDQVVEAHRRGVATGIRASATGTAGLAALLNGDMTAEITPEDHVAVLFTGAERGS